MRTIADMAKGAVTGMAIHDLPDRIPSLDDCAICALTKSHRPPFKKGRTRAARPLELRHGDLVGPMPVESICGRGYGFLLVDDYSRASWALPLRNNSDAPIEFEEWIKQVENEDKRKVAKVLFDNARELVEGKTREICDARGICTTSTIPYSTSSNGVAERLVGDTSEGIRAILHDSGLPSRFWVEAMKTFMRIRNKTPTNANRGKMPYELYYNMKPSASHIRPFGCVKVTLPTEKLKKFNHRAVMRYLIGYNYEGACRLWIPKMGIKEARDVVLYDKHSPVLPEDGVTIEASQAQPASPLFSVTRPAAAGHTTASQVPQEHVTAFNGGGERENEGSREKLTIRIQGRYHPRAQKPQDRPEISADEHDEPMDSPDDEVDAAPQYVGPIHGFTARATRSGKVRDAAGGGAMLAYTAFDALEPEFAPTPTTPDPKTVRDALKQQQ